MATLSSTTYWQRLEPRPRSNNPAPELAAEVRDPLWMLTRQWQLGEFMGEDAGSLAYVEYSAQSSPTLQWQGGAASHAVDANTPLERHTLQESIEPDLTMRVEFGALFTRELKSLVTDPTARERLLASARTKYPLALPPLDPFAPVDPETTGFMAVCGGRVPDGYSLLELARAVEGGGNIPSDLTTDPGEIEAVKTALGTLAAWTRATYGEVGFATPEAWVPEQLDYQLTVEAGNPAGGVATLRAEPDQDGEYHWSSFDVLATNTGAPAPATSVLQETLVPHHLRFEGMPSPRYWSLESNEAPLTAVSGDTTDLPVKLVVDFALIHGVDWYVFPLRQPVGTLTRLDYLVVHDVFGGATLIERADQGATATGVQRWTMYSHSKLDAQGSDIGVSDYLYVPPASGGLAARGALLEQVYFARDEVANMAWGIERITASPLGQARHGDERNAAVKRADPPSVADPADDAPLRYSIESEIPVHWTPLLATRVNEELVFEKAGVARPLPDGTIGVVLPIGRVLNPTWATPKPTYQIRLEQVPRIGKTVERMFHYGRWIDGSAHLWVARQRKAGRGETRSNLRFDQAIVNER